MTFLMVFAIYQHESAIGKHVSTPILKLLPPPSRSIPLGCPRALALGVCFMN